MADNSQAESCVLKRLLDAHHLSSPATTQAGNSSDIDHSRHGLLHAVMVPYPLQGHINPMVQFAKTLVTKHGFIVTFVNNEHNHNRIQEETRSKSSSSTSCNHTITKYDGAELSQQNLRFVWVENGLPPDFDYSDIFPRFSEFHEASIAMKAPLKDLIESFNIKKNPPVTCVVFGSFCPWAHSVALELNIPSVFFWTQSAAVFSIYYHSPKLVSHGFFPYNKTRPECNEDHEPEHTDLISWIPGVPPLHPASFPTLLHIDDISDLSFKPVKDQFDTLESCDAVVINSYEELEKDASEALQAELMASSVFLVGPLLPSAFLDGSDMKDTSVGASLLQEKNDCIKWLDSKQKQSVLYISFGSVFNPSAEDLQSIALGIEASKQPFLWVIRPTSSLQNLSEILPHNFLQDTKDDGLIIPWAPQLQVLSHPSVGAFLTHCGWNSTLESLSMGVPMIPFPIHSDQTTNCKYVVDVWKVGMSINKRQGHDGKVVSEEVERVVRIVLQGEEGKEMRRRAGKLKEAARRAVQAEGTSNAHMEKFIEAVRDAKTH